MSASYVWYTAFGSNLSSARFSAYLDGGVPEDSPAGVRELGARDPSPPTARGTVVVPHKLYFAHSSNRWGGGGVAFLDSAPGISATLCRTYRITSEQLADVHAQESRESRTYEIDLPELVERGHTDCFTSLYGRLLCLGRHESGEPTVTITTGRDDLVRNNPHPSYLRTIATGLREAHGLTASEIIEYLSAAEGVDHRPDDPIWSEIT